MRTKQIYRAVDHLWKIESFEAFVTESHHCVTVWRHTMWDDILFVIFSLFIELIWKKN